MFYAICHFLHCGPGLRNVVLVVAPRIVVAPEPHRPDCNRLYPGAQCHTVLLVASQQVHSSGLYRKNKRQDGRGLGRLQAGTKADQGIEMVHRYDAVLPDQRSVSLLLCSLR